MRSPPRLRPSAKIAECDLRKREGREDQDGRDQKSEVGGQRSKIRLVLFVRGDDAAAALRTLPVALLEVGARVSDVFTTVLARYCDLLVFRHAAGITESCPDASSRPRAVDRKLDGGGQVKSRGE
jgi:hypothetical protein